MLKFRSISFLLISLLLISLFLGCTHTTNGITDPTTPEGEQAKRYYDKGTSFYKKGEYKNSISQFEIVLVQFSDTRYAASSDLYIAKCYAKQKKYTKAINKGKEVLNDFSGSHIVDETLFLIGEWYIKTGEYFSASSRYITIIDRDKEPKYIDSAEDRISELINHRLRYNEMRVLADKFSSSKVRAQLVFKMAQIDYDEAKYSSTISLLNDFEKKYPDNFLLSSAQKLLKKAREKLGIAGNNNTIKSTGKIKLAILLPLSGEFEMYGTGVKEGIEMALAEANYLYPDLKIIPLIIDTKSDAVNTIKEMVNLIKDPDIIAFIGPVANVSTLAASGLATAFKIPLITPTASRNGIGSISKYVFQLNAPAEAEGAAIARYALSSLGMRRFAILHDNSSYARSQTSSFVKMVKDFKAEIIAIERYAPGDTDFKDQLKSIEKFHADAIFIPARPSDIIMIAPQIAYYEIYSRLLGTGTWNDERVINLGDPRIYEYYVEGALFATDFYVDTAEPNFQKFSNDYEARYQTMPDKMASLGYDATQLVIHCLVNGATNREELTTFLQEINNYKGVSGQINFNEEGAAEKKLKILRITKGNLEEIQW